VQVSAASCGDNDRARLDTWDAAFPRRPNDPICIQSAPGTGLRLPRDAHRSLDHVCQISPRDQAEFAAFLDQVTKAHAQYIRGQPEPFKALWSRAPDVTIFGGFGSGEHGWEQVGPRLDWASTQFSEGERDVERIASHVDGNLGYVVQIERIRFKVPGQSDPSLLELRVTMIFRKEAGTWRIVHRHGDSQMKRQGTR
jgi:ketosteroid isomerase-like protein